MLAAALATIALAAAPGDQAYDVALSIARDGTRPAAGRLERKAHRRMKRRFERAGLRRARAALRHGAWALAQRHRRPRRRTPLPACADGARRQRAAGSGSDRQRVGRGPAGRARPAAGGDRPSVHGLARRHRRRGGRSTPARRTTSARSPCAGSCRGTGCATRCRSTRSAAAPRSGCGRRSRAATPRRARAAGRRRSRRRRARLAARRAAGALGPSRVRDGGHARRQARRARQPVPPHGLRHAGPAPAAAPSGRCSGWSRPCCER